MKTLLLFFSLSIYVVVGQPIGTMYDPALLKSSRFSVTARGVRHAAGLETFSTGTAVGGGTTVPGRTFCATDNLDERFRFGGTVKQGRFWLSSLGELTPCYTRMKVYRQAGTFSMIGESELLTIAATGTNLFVFTNTFSALEGDCFGIFMTNGSVSGPQLKITAKIAAVGMRYDTGNITGSGFSWTSSLANNSLDIEALLDDPVFLFGGDSIMAGHNAGASWLTWVETGGPSGTIGSSIPYQISLLLKRNAGYANNSHGSYTWSSVVSTTLPIMQTNASAWIFHCGVNDVSGARSWANVLADLNSIKAALPTGCRLYIDEILPWTAGDDAEAATIRTFNANYSEWCAANGATLIPCHDAMGQIRISTGQLDDLLTAYDQDGVHVTMAGVLKMAQILYQVLARDFGI